MIHLFDSQFALILRKRNVIFLRIDWTIFLDTHSIDVSWLIDKTTQAEVSMTMTSLLTPIPAALIT